jgi:hypothetical protein
MSVEQDIAKALANLGAIGGRYQAPKIDFSGFDGYGTKYKTDYAFLPSIDWKGAAGNPSSSKSKKGKTDFKPNLWDVLSGTLGQPGGIVTDKIYDVTSAGKNIGKKGNNKPLWEEIADAMYSVSPGKTAEKAIVNGVKGQKKAWTDDKWTWGDIPGFGAAHGIDKGWKRGTDIAKDHMKIENKKGQVAAGIGMDILFDPLTYLTGGASMAAKAGKVKEAAKIAQIGKKMGITKKMKNVDELLDEARNILTKKYPNLAKSPQPTVNPSWRNAGKQVAPTSIIDKQLAKIADEVKAARNQAYNAKRNNWGFSVPFSNKASVAVGSYKPGGLFHTSEAILGAKNVHLAQQLIQAAAKTAENIPVIENAVKNLYKVDDLSQLSKTMYSDLVSRLTPVIEKGGKGLPDAKVTDNIVEKTMPNEIFNIKTKQGMPNETVQYNKLTAEDVLRNVQVDPKVAAKIAPMLTGMDDLETIRKLAPEAVEMFGEFAPKIMKTVKGKTGDAVKQSFNEVANYLKGVSHTGRIIREPQIVYKEVERIVETFRHGTDAVQAAKQGRNVANALAKPFGEMLDGTSGFEDWLRKMNPFDARTLKTGDKFLDSMGDHIADADSMRVGENAMYQKAIQDIEKFIKKAGITPEDMKKLIYFLEGEYPKGMSPDDVPDKVKELASLVKPLLDEVGTDDIAAGVLGKTRENYFPHVVTKSQDEINDILDFKAKREDPSSLAGKQLGSKHDKSRTSFETIAQQENYLDDLAAKINAATDDAEIEALTEQMKKVEGMFDTDVTSALTRRIKEGVRARSIKAMQGELSKYGMMVSNPTDVTAIKGLKRLSNDEASKLGLGKGEHYINEKVLDGMKRVDDVFTNQGMNKAVRHLNAFSDVWRSMVTHYKPSHYRNNIIGNVITNMAAGVSAGDYKKAMKLVTGYRKGTLSPEQMKLMKTAYSKNVVSGGFLTDATRTFKFDEPTKLEKVADFVTDNKGISKVRQAGEVADDITRLANFLGGMRKFGDSTRAAKQVREYLFNYNELTNADRHMRTLVPFWNWTKRNVPLQVKLLMEQPQFAMNVERFKNLFNEGEEGEEWQKEMGIKIPGMDYYTGIPSPTHDLNAILDPSSQLGSMNPALKMFLETQMNRKFFTNKPITYGNDDVSPEDLPEYFAKNFGITGNLYDAATGKKNVGEALINLFNPIYGIQEK